jgi:predicted nucleotidyltransferase
LPLGLVWRFRGFRLLLHGFYHPKFSDIDLIVYGRRKFGENRKLSQELYEDKSSGFSNEFEDDFASEGGSFGATRT